MSYWPHPIGILAGGLSEITVFNSATGTGATITAPSGVQAGDLLVYHDVATGSTVPTAVTPTGFTLINNITTTSTRQITAYKLADGSEGGTNLTGMVGTTNGGAAKTLYVFRGNVGAGILTLGSANQQATDSDPSAQNVTSGSGLAPLVVLGFYGGTASTGISTRTMSPAKDGEINSTINVTLDPQNWTAYKIYNNSPADVSVDMNDEGNNTLQSCYIQMA